ncbi:Ff.00g065730.m01.CDS01 [Fusarium sp. VM40]|nr:Ff.00g065730.m01.CDS01 [Fusarium sp. VM40]
MHEESSVALPNDDMGIETGMGMDEDLEQRFPSVSVKVTTAGQSIICRLAPGQWLNDNTINTALSRLASDSVGVIGSLSVCAIPSPRLVERLNSTFTTKPAVLIPRAPGTLDVFDSCRNMPDTTTEVVKQFVKAVSKAGDMECSQQANAFEFGVFIIQFAHLIASGKDPATSIVLFDSESLDLSSDKVQPEILDLATHIQLLRHGIHTLHLRQKSSIAEATKTQPLESMPAFLGIANLRGYVGQRESVAGKFGPEDCLSMPEAIRPVLKIISKMEAGMQIARRRFQARYGECIVLFLVLRYARKKFDVLQMKLATVRK